MRYVFSVLLSVVELDVRFKSVIWEVVCLDCIMQAEERSSIAVYLVFFWLSAVCVYTRERERGCVCVCVCVCVLC
jgi:hypothetical protein